MRTEDLARLCEALRIEYSQLKPLDLKGTKPVENRYPVLDNDLAVGMMRRVAKLIRGVVMLGVDYDGEARSIVQLPDGSFHVAIDQDAAGAVAAGALAALDAGAFELEHHT